MAKISQELRIGKAFSVESWPDVEEGALSAKDLEHFHRRKQAVLLYLRDASYLALYEATGFKARYINHTTIYPS